METKTIELTKDIESVKTLMLSSQSANEWDANCDKVRKMFGGIPEFYYREIITSGIYKESRKNWK